MFCKLKSAIITKRKRKNQLTLVITLTLVLWPKLKHKKKVGQKNILKFKHTITSMWKWIPKLQVVFWFWELKFHNLIPIHQNPKEEVKLLNWTCNTTLKRSFQRLHFFSFESVSILSSYAWELWINKVVKLITYQNQNFPKNSQDFLSLWYSFYH